MADINKEINDFRNAIYGEEVRGSMISLAEKLNTEIEKGISDIEGATDAANNAAAATQETIEHYDAMAEQAQKALDGAQQAEQDAKTAAGNAQQYSKDSKRWAVGDESSPGSETDNSKYYCEQSKAASAAASKSEASASDSADSASESAASAQGLLEQTKEAGENALKELNDALAITLPEWSINYETGHLEYQGGRFEWQIENSNGHLMWEVAI